MPVPEHHRHMAALRAACNPGLLMIVFVLLATVVAASAVVAQRPPRVRTLTVSPAGAKPDSAAFAAPNSTASAAPDFTASAAGDAGAKPIPSTTPAPPSPSGNPVIGSAPAIPPVPPVVLIPTNATPTIAAAPNTAPPAVVPVQTPAPPAVVPVQTPAPPAARDAVVAYALRQLGKPYRFGAAGDSSFDCSGLVMRAWQAAGVSLPHSTYEMARLGSRITRDQLLPGDLVFLNGYGHVQLYIGDGNVVEAPHAGAVVSISSLPSSADAYVRLNDAGA